MQHIRLSERVSTLVESAALVAVLLFHTGMSISAKLGSDFESIADPGVVGSS